MENIWIYGHILLYNLKYVHNTIERITNDIFCQYYLT